MVLCALCQELSGILFYLFMFLRTLAASHVKCYQSIAVIQVDVAGNIFSGREKEP